MTSKRSPASMRASASFALVAATTSPSVDEQPLEREAHDRLVVDDQDASSRRGLDGAAGASPRRGAAAGRSHRARRRGQLDAEDAPLAHLALDRRASRRGRVTMPWQMASPSPVPMPTGFVVKNGSKMRPRTCGGMPTPLSRDLDDDAVRPDRAHDDADLVVLAAVLGHRLHGVDEQVEEHLAEARLVRDDLGHVRDSPSRAARGGGSRFSPSRAPPRPPAGRPAGATVSFSGRENVFSPRTMSRMRSAPLLRVVERDAHLAGARASDDAPPKQAAGAPRRRSRG